LLEERERSRIARLPGGSAPTGFLVGLLATRPNPFEQRARRFVGRVLGDGVADEGAGEDRLARPLGA
jgi:hypothetical protein